MLPNISQGTVPPPQQSMIWSPRSESAKVENLCLSPKLSYVFLVHTVKMMVNTVLECWLRFVKNSCPSSPSLSPGWAEHSLFTPRFDNPWVWLCQESLHHFGSRGWICLPKFSSTFTEVHGYARPASGTQWLQMWRKQVGSLRPPRPSASPSLLSAPPT